MGQFSNTAILDIKSVLLITLTLKMPKMHRTKFISAKFNPVALRTAKTLLSFGRSECNRVKKNYHMGNSEIGANSVNPR